MLTLTTSHLLACPSILPRSSCLRSNDREVGRGQSAAPRVLFFIFYFLRLPMPIATARPLFRWILLAMLLLVVSPDAFAQPRDKCAEERADAENLYLEGQFDEAIRLLQACVVREELFVMARFKGQRL